MSPKVPSIVKTLATLLTLKGHRGCSDLKVLQLGYLWKDEEP